MPGQVIQRSARTWLVRIYLGREGTGGRRRYVNKTVHGTKKDAERWLTAALRDRDLGVFVEPSTTTLDGYLDRWIADATCRRVRERTLRDYEAVLARYVRPVLGKRRLSQIRALDLQALYTGMHERGLSPRTVRYAHAIVSSALRQAVKWQLLPQNPANFVDLPRREHREMRVLDAEQVGRFLAAAEGTRYGLAFVVALATGMRPGEYLALRWADVDFDVGRVAVQRALVWLGGKWSFAEPKTKQSRRSIPLPASVVRLLRDHRRRQAAERLAAGPVYESRDLVFATDSGGPLDLRNLTQRHFKAILKTAGLPSATRLYDLRHTSATMLLAAGEHPKVVSERLGHATVTLTLDTYSHVLPTMQEAAANRLEVALFGRTP